MSRLASTDDQESLAPLCRQLTVPVPRVEAALTLRLLGVPVRIAALALTVRWD